MMNHYVTKRQITRSVVLGVPATALCGEVLTPEGQGAEAISGGLGTGNKTLSTCPVCELFFHALADEVEQKIGNEVKS